jgi:hypothetical protein
MTWMKADHDPHLAVLQEYYAMYNEDRFGRIYDLITDNITSFRPEMQNFRGKLLPVTLPRDVFIRQHAIIKGHFGKITPERIDVGGDMICASVAFEAGHVAANTIMFSGDGRIASTFVTRTFGQRFADLLGSPR